MDFSVEDLPRAFGSDLLEVEWNIPSCKSLKDVEGHKSSTLPSVEKYTLQEEFADVYMGISKTEIFVVASR